MSYDWEDKLMGIFLPVMLFLVISAVLVAIVAGGIDVVFRVKAEPAAIACEAQRMEARRVSFSSNVICVPKARDTRSDTITVQGGLRHE
jgi:hypothetical protein